MGISTNAQRVVRIYRGSTKVWEDPAYGEWQDIVWSDGQKSQCLVGNGVICFKGDLIFEQYNTDVTLTAKLPIKSTLLSLLSPGFIADGYYHWTFSCDSPSNSITISFNYGITTQFKATWNTSQTLLAFTK